MKGDKVCGIIKSASTVGVFDMEPVLTDRRQKNTAGGQVFINDSAEILTRLDIGHIHEDGVVAEGHG